MKRTKYIVSGMAEEQIARFSSYRQAMLFGSMMSEIQSARLIEIAGKDGLVGQYSRGKTTPEFELHHSNCFR